MDFCFCVICMKSSYYIHLLISALGTKIYIFPVCSQQQFKYLIGPTERTKNKNTALVSCPKTEGEHYI